MTNRKYQVNVPRNTIIRFFVRLFLRILLPILARVEVVGKENFPKSGKAILISNHVAVMEPVMMVAYAPRQIEFLGSVDVPHEPSTQWAMDFYGMIEIFRGKPERQALKQAISVLEQGGLLAIFPEGGLWNPGTMKPKDGVAFLSHRSGAPVIPVSLVGTKGALNQLFAFKRPALKMIVGEPIPACTVGEDDDIRQVYQQYSGAVMDQVFAQLPKSMLEEMYDIQWEKFDLIVKVTQSDGTPAEIPERLNIQHPEELALLLHRPGILKIFRVNLHMPVEPLEHLQVEPSPASILAAIDPMIQYLQDEENGNPYLLTYRFDVDRGKAMLSALQELAALLTWAIDEGLRVKLEPERRFFSRKQQKEFIQVKQGEFDHWR